MYVKNAVYKEIKPGWKGITLPLKAGTPMNAAGQIVNGAGAIGIVPQTITVMPVTPTINLLVGGSVSLAEVNAAYGSALTKAAKESMNGIAFFGEDGTPEPDPIWKGETVPGTLPAVTSTDNGKTLVVTEGAWAVGSGGGGGTGGGVLVIHDNDGTLDKTWQEIADAGFAILNIEYTVGFTCDIHHSDAYYVTFVTFLSNGTGFDDPIGYTTNSANGYPVMSD